MLEERRIQKTCRSVKETWKYFDKYVEKACKLTIYIKPGFQKPTIFVAIATVDGMEVEPILQVVNFGVLSASEIVEAAKMIQTVQVSPKTWKCPMSFAVEDTNMKAFLQDNGVDNAIVVTKEYYEKVLKAIDIYYHKENKECHQKKRKD